MNGTKREVEAPAETSTGISPKCSEWIDSQVEMKQEVAEKTESRFISLLSLLPPVQNRAELFCDTR